MKKLFALILVAVMALALVACGEEKLNTPATENIESSMQTASSDSTETTEEKPDASAETETDTSVNSTNSDTNTETENKEPTLDDLFKTYPADLSGLGLFDAVANLDSVRIFDWAKKFCKPVSETKDMEKYIFSYTYASADLNEYAFQYLGHGFAFDTINGEPSSDHTEYSYNEEDDSVTVTYYGAFGDVGPEITYVNTVAKDDTHYIVNYTKTYPGDAPEAYFLEVEFADGNYLVRAQKKAAGDVPPPATDATDKTETADKTPSAEEIGMMLHECSYLSQYLIVHYEQGPNFNAKQILTYFINNICADLEVSLGDKVPAEKVYEYVEKSFDLDEAMKTMLKSCELYNTADDTFTVWGEYYSNSVHTTCVYAFEEQGNNEYVLYIKYGEWNSDINVMQFSNLSDWKATVTYRPEMKPSDFKFLWHSFEKIDQVPAGATLTGINHFAE